MKGNRVVDPCANSGFQKTRLQCFPILYTNDVEVVNTFRPGSLNRNYHRILHFRKQLVIPVGKIAPRLIPLGQMAQFHREPARLNGVQPPVITFDVVVILFCLAVIADHLHPLGHLFVVRSDRSRFAAGSQILARIKTERGSTPHRAGLFPDAFLAGKIFSPVSLAGIFNHHQVVFAGEVQNRVHIRRLAVEMNRNDRRNHTF